MRNLLQSMVVCTFIGLLMVLVTGILPIGVMFLGVIALIITTLIASKLKWPKLELNPPPLKV